jgi:DNA-binding NarL/FixJ family response regulator
VRHLLGAAERAVGPLGVARARAVAREAGLDGAVEAACSLAEGLVGDEAPARLMTARLTPREVEVLTLLARGLADREIGARLAMSAKTVSVHLAHVRAKTGIRSRIDLAVAGAALVGPEGLSPARGARPIARPAS